MGVSRSDRRDAVLDLPEDLLLRRARPQHFIELEVLPPARLWHSHDSITDLVCDYSYLLLLSGTKGQ